jgi:hypothetical protein
MYQISKERSLDMLNKKYIIHQFDELGSQRFKRKQRLLRKLERRLYFSQIKKRNTKKQKLEVYYR